MINFLITNLDLSNLFLNGYVLSSLGIFSILGSGYLLKSKFFLKSNNNLNHSNDVRDLEKNLMDDLDLIDDIDDSSILTDTTLKQIKDNTLNKSFNDVSTSPITSNIELKDVSISPMLPIIELKDVGTSPMLIHSELKDESVQVNLIIPNNEKEFYIYLKDLFTRYFSSRSEINPSDYELNLVQDAVKATIPLENVSEIDKQERIQSFINSLPKSQSIGCSTPITPIPEIIITSDKGLSPISFNLSNNYRGLNPISTNTMDKLFISNYVDKGSSPIISNLLQDKGSSPILSNLINKGINTISTLLTSDKGLSPITINLSDKNINTITPLLNDKGISPITPNLTNLPVVNLPSSSSNQDVNKLDNLHDVVTDIIDTIN